MVEITYLVPITTAVVQAISMAVNFDGRYKPVISIVVAGVLSYLLAIGGDVKDIILSALVGGLGASGLYDVAKKTILNK